MSAIQRMIQERFAKPYVMKVDKKSGGLYLEREKNPLLAEVPYVIVLIIAVMFAIFSCCQYIYLRTNVECRIRTLQDLERQVVLLTNDNILAEKYMASSGMTDLNYVYTVATETLGMVPVTEYHVIYYDRSDSEFVYQRQNMRYSSAMQ